MDRAQELTPPTEWSWRTVAVPLALWVVGAFVLTVFTLRFGYHGAFVWLNAHTPALSWRYLTQLGDSLIGGGLMVIAVLTLPSPRKLHERLALVAVGVLLLVVLGLVVQLLKRQVFGGWHRPLGLFEGGWPIVFTDVEGGRYFSFPSGHAKTAIASALIVAFAVRGWAQILVAAVGLVVAYSRVAVGMHYPMDVVAGAALAVAFGLPAVGYATPRWSATFSRASERVLRLWRWGLVFTAALLVLLEIWLRFGTTG